MISSLSETRAVRWNEERAYFDSVARNTTLTPINPSVIARYSKPKGLTHREFRHALAGDLAGKRVLDVGCGSGENASLMALLGAHVTGIDISAESISLAERRAAVNGVVNRTRFVCAPIETVAFADTFDIVWIDAFLHHVIADLPTLMPIFAQWVAPGGKMICGEPVSTSRAIRKLRLVLPIPASGTPDERPLEPVELRLIHETGAKRGLRGSRRLLSRRLHGRVPAAERLS